MGTQRKNDATYSHPWRDYFPIEGAIKQLSNYLKQEMFIFQTSTFDEMLLKLVWESNSFTGGYIGWNRICFSLQKKKKCIASYTSPEKLNWNNHTTVDAYI